MLEKLTDRYVQSLKPPARGLLEVTDTEAPGLMIRVTTDGAKAWSIRYRPKGGDQRRITIGPYPGLKLVDARTRAYAITAAAKQGVDLPLQEQRARDEERKAAERPHTVQDLTGRYIEDYAKANQRRWKMTERLFQMHVDPKLGRMALSELRRADVVTLLDDLQNKKKLGAQVNRVRSQLLAALNWAVEREWLSANPAAAVRKKKIETARARVLTDDELRAIWWAALKVGYPGGSFIRALMLSPQRRDEVRCLPRTELNGRHGDWIIPGSRNKGKRDHLVPLSDALKNLFAEDCAESGPFMFSVDGKKPYAGHKRLKAIIDRESGVKGWTFHDIRRTISTRLAELGVPREVRRHLLNHARPQLDEVYDVYEFRAEKARALQTWTDHLTRLTSAKDVETKYHIQAEKSYEPFFLDDHIHRGAGVSKAPAPAGSG